MWINQTMRIKIIIIQLFYKCIMVIIKKLLLITFINDLNNFNFTFHSLLLLFKRTKK